MNSNKITNIGNPTSDNDAVAKLYFDEKFTSITNKLSGYIKKRIRAYICLITCI